MAAGMDTQAALEQARDAGWDRLYPSDRTRITVGMGTCGKAAGAEGVFDAIARIVERDGLPIDVEPVGCAGMCFAEPLVEVAIPGCPRALYGEVDEGFCESLLEAVAQDRYPKRHRIGFAYRDWAEGFDDWIPLDDEESDDRPDDIERHPFLSQQVKRVTANWGRIIPWSVEEYAATGGYEALCRAVLELSPDDIIADVEASGLRGRGGAGFPTGRKWRSAAASDDPVRFVVANADEGDPGAYMDRGLLESDPHRLIEGMGIAARAIGAQRGYVFTRSEYPGAVEALERALAEARERGFIGEGAFDGAWSFDIDVVQSAGAYVCGEEGALLEALEGRRPDPRQKPPYPSERGLGGHPTCINNVETYANVPSIVLHGPDRFRSCGTEDSPGTKVFSLAGSIQRTGLVEVPFGISPKAIVCDIAGIEHESFRNIVTEEPEGTNADDPFEGISVQIGGPSGAILPLSLPDLSLDFEGLSRAGGIVGSGGVVVLGKRTCVVDTVRYFLEFSARSSCGRCATCRDGIAEAAEIVGKICEGRGSAADLDELERLAHRIPRGSRCALGKMAVNPLASGLRFFRPEFESHIAGSCPGLVCKELIHFEVIASACPGCLCCLPSCPTGAIKGRYGKPFVIDQEKCTKCWMCVSQCPYPALMAFSRPAALDEAADGTASGEGGCEAAAEATAGEAAAQEKPATREGSLEGCILCGRCVDVCREKGGNALFFSGRGQDRVLVKPLYDGQSACIDCGACFEACPTDAIRNLVPTEFSRRR